MIDIQFNQILSYWRLIGRVSGFQKQDTAVNLAKEKIAEMPHELRWLDAERMSASSSSSSSCRDACTDIPDPLSPFLPIVHRLRQVFRATFRIRT